MGSEDELERRDFFISYTGADLSWARWIAWELEVAGYSTVFQEWDFQAGANFVLEMHRAAQRTDQHGSMDASHEGCWPESSTSTWST
jgi:hypothetical protein